MLTTQLAAIVTKAGVPLTKELETAFEDVYILGCNESSVKRATMSALDTQILGDHYKGLVIQPVVYIHKNNLPFIEGCIVKYITRWRDKGGVKDLEKIKHFVDLLIELEGLDDDKAAN